MQPYALGTPKAHCACPGKTSQSTPTISPGLQGLLVACPVKEKTTPLHPVGYCCGNQHIQNKHQNASNGAAVLPCRQPCCKQTAAVLPCRQPFCILPSSVQKQFPPAVQSPDTQWGCQRYPTSIQICCTGGGGVEQAVHTQEGTIAQKGRGKYTLKHTRLPPPPLHTLQAGANIDVVT